ncbi:isochorismatase hydrolase [Stylonychia lemnae]|uniref:Isochorismatase hydrolase n=1 Tax=Stylonychia lemnae TaxID=5949 RepID=A0A078ACX8_STYLE|nr:isochorismatase hydrolase [Stylonychia lemnae]|eukprot:CDW79716.1 isochorismatase hydrolase [Stylonychia lemnae]
MRTLIRNFDTVSHNAQRLGKMASLFGIPLISTAQTAKVFGPTIKELNDVYATFPETNKPAQFEKITFSMIDEQVRKHFSQFEKSSVVLYGVEAHICVKQTCLDLLDMGYDVHLVIDSVSSMSYHDRTVGIESLRDAGAYITTFQSLAFELARSPEVQVYKDLLKLIKDMPKEHLSLYHDQQQASKL